MFAGTHRLAEARTNDECEEKQGYGGSFSVVRFSHRLFLCIVMMSNGRNLDSNSAPI